jgi:hypothetical protein
MSERQADEFRREAAEIRRADWPDGFTPAEIGEQEARKEWRERHANLIPNINAILSGRRGK